MTRKNFIISSKNSKLSQHTQIPQIKKALQRYLGLMNYYRNYIPRMAVMLNPLNKLLNAETPINITSELKKKPLTL